MKKILLIVLITGVWPGLVKAQLYIGITAGPKWEQFGLQDAGQRLVEQQTLTTTRYGIEVWLVGGKNYQWSFGLQRYQFSSYPVDLRQANIVSEGNALISGNTLAGALLLPVGVKYDFWRPGRSSLFIHPSLGIGILPGQPVAGIAETGALTDRDGNIIFSYEIREAYERSLFFLPKIGLGYERPFLNRGKLQIGLEYFVGTTDITRSGIFYRLPPDDFEANAVATSRGTAFGLNFALLYPITK
ncbi:hypothetical protein AB9P05_13880 [Roseivirga sp. BDSF3-8]|uniref:hypothetical protein n=1 Tax=Roseivirga sp. BDSF3-8 TaxID=3241598 RepID=UPI0035321D4C